MLLLLIGFIGSFSYDDVLEFVPDTNTTFTCVGMETDDERGITFGVDDRVYRIDELEPDVRFVYRYRTVQSGQLIATTTVILSAKVNGSILSCCYINQSVTSWRESFLLVCCAHGNCR